MKKNYNVEFVNATAGRLSGALCTKCMFSNLLLNMHGTQLHFWIFKHNYIAATTTMLIFHVALTNSILLLRIRRCVSAIVLFYGFSHSRATLVCKAKKAKKRCNAEENVWCCFFCVVVFVCVQSREYLALHTHRAELLLVLRES